ncbi:CapA family protein [Kineococcus sp. SYSU DK003]|uniref:CapA family protein n=1 Tax=Kineococcus sp. SYSU DK003 TaxID=3383124 RepID=UPI003D7E7505
MTATSPVTLAVTGDVNFAGASAAALAPGGLDAVAPVLAAADLTVVNLETAVTDRGTPVAKQFTFRAPAAAFPALQAAGVDVVGLANNHGVDYGLVGLRDTLAAAGIAQFPLVGAGEDVEEAFAPYTADVGGHRVAVLDATQVLDASLAADWTATATHPGLAVVQDRAGVDRLLAAVRAVRPSVESVVVLLHWGQEKNSCPLPRQQTLAAELVAAGADAVVGSHAHVQLGNGWLHAGGRTGFVDYGLGNFVFSARSGATTSTGVLRLTLPGAGGVSAASWSPARIEAGIPHLLTGAQARQATAAKDALRECTGLSATP